MFKNVGRKIQTLTSVFFFFEFLISCLAGIGTAALISSFSYNSDRGTTLVIGLIVALIGIFFSWMSYLKLYAYGKIAESCEEQCSLLRQILAAQAEPRTCGKCGASLEADAAFCPDCGTPYQGR